MSHLTSEDFSEITPEDQYPETFNICSINQWKQNWKCIFLTCLICSCLISILYCHRQLSNQISISEDYGNSKYWVLIFCAAFLYSLYIIECSFATGKIQLCSHKSEHIERVKEKIERMKNSNPTIWWKGTCYHFVRRKRRTTQYNRRGSYFVSTKVYQERVNSFSSSSIFNYSCCGVSDISNNLIFDNNCKPIVKFSFSKGFAFSNMASAIEFEEQRSMFFRELRRYDDFMDIHEGLDLNDCSSFEEEHVAINTSNGKIPWFADPFYYWLCSCFLLSWPFRIVLFYNTVHVQFKITKLFGTNYNNWTESTQHLALLQFYGSCSGDSDGDRDDTSTPDWLDTAPLTGSRAEVDQITTLVPSYSEALLLLDDQHLTDELPAAPLSFVEALHKNNNPLQVEDASVRRRHTSPSTVNALHVSRTPRTPRRGNDNAGTTSEIPPVESDQLGVDKPPTYEEALIFPVIEHPRCSVSNASLNSGIVRTISTVANSAQLNNQTETQFSNEIRLPNPNCRTFLSIETSL